MSILQRLCSAQLMVRVFVYKRPTVGRYNRTNRVGYTRVANTPSCFAKLSTCFFALLSYLVLALGGVSILLDGWGSRVLLAGIGEA